MAASLTFPHEQVHAFVAGLFRSAGVPTNDADRVAECLVQADLRGVSSHGGGRAPIYFERLRKGLVNPYPAMIERALTVAARVPSGAGKYER